MREAMRALAASDRPRWDDALRFAPDATKGRLSKFQPCLPDGLARELMVEKLVDLATARRVLGLVPEVERVAVPAVVATPSLPIVWVRGQDELVALAAALEAEPTIALDVETSLTDTRLCPIQVGASSASYRIDPFVISDLTPLGRVLESPHVEKVIHNAQFERSVLGARGLRIENVLDTMVASRQRCGPLGAGHGLKAVCRRELDLVIDKRCQTSDWTTRPLSSEQERYAALDVELLVRLAPLLRRS